MLVLHAHWQPPRTPTDTGGVLFWAETSDAPQPPRRRGRLARNPKPKDHPFCAPFDALRRLPGLDLRGTEAQQGRATLRLPSTRTGPQPSPALLHDWDLDEKTPPFLAPWHVHGLWLPAAPALMVLAGLPGGGVLQVELWDGALPSRVALAADARYWRMAAALVLETLAAQKLVPVLAPADAAGRTFHARWLPILDGPKDAPRLARLEAAMPPICRAEVSARNTPTSPRPDSGPAPRALLDTFLKTTTDALARRWGRPAAPRLPGDDDPAHRWLIALFSDDPTVDASPAQLQALARSHRGRIGRRGAGRDHPSGGNDPQFLGDGRVVGIFPIGYQAPVGNTARSQTIGGTGLFGRRLLAKSIRPGLPGHHPGGPGNCLWQWRGTRGARQSRVVAWSRLA